MTSPGGPLCGFLRLALAREEAVPTGRDRLVAMLLERGAIVVRHHLDEAELRRLPLVEQTRRDGRAGPPLVLVEQLPQSLEIVNPERFEPDQLTVAALLERAVRVEHVRDAAAHAGREV